MSFILDALKKSESDRQRQTGPALFEVKVASPKARFPVWAVAIVGLLVINMVIVGWLLLRRSSRGDDTAAATQNAPPAATASVQALPAAAPMAAQPAPNGNDNGPGTNAPSNNSGATRFAPPSMQPANAQQSSALSNPPGEQPDPPPARLPDRDQNEPTLASTPRDSGADSGASPDDYAPAADPGSPLFKGHVKRGTEGGYMLYQDLAVTTGADLPQLRLDLHVYAAKPQDRFALINMHKMHEGDSLQGGIRVEAITPDGVVMSHNGTKFLLPRE